MFKRICALVSAAAILVSAQSAFAYDPNWWAVDTVEAAMECSLISDQYGDKPYTDAITRSDFINVAVNIYATITAENVSSNANSPFVDTDGVFPNMAYYAGIISAGFYNETGDV